MYVCMCVCLYVLLLWWSTSEFRVLVTNVLSKLFVVPCFEAVVEIRAGGVDVVAAVWTEASELHF